MQGGGGSRVKCGGYAGFEKTSGSSGTISPTSEKILAKIGRLDRVGRYSRTFSSQVKSLINLNVDSLSSEKAMARFYTLYCSSSGRSNVISHMQ